MQFSLSLSLLVKWVKSTSVEKVSNRKDAVVAILQSGLLQYVPLEISFEDKERINKDGATAEYREGQDRESEVLCRTKGVYNMQNGPLARQRCGSNRAGRKCSRNLHTKSPLELSDLHWS